MAVRPGPQLVPEPRDRSRALAEWRRDVSRQLADPDFDPFIASAGVVVVLGGRHTDTDFCWCQPAMALHGCGHRHGEHRGMMD